WNSGCVSPAPSLPARPEAPCRERTSEFRNRRSGRHVECARDASECFPGCPCRSGRSLRLRSLLRWQLAKSGELSLFEKTHTRFPALVQAHGHLVGGTDGLSAFGVLLSPQYHPGRDQ